MKKRKFLFHLFIILIFLSVTACTKKLSEETVENILELPSEKPTEVAVEKLAQEEPKEESMEERLVGKIQKLEWTKNVSQIILIVGTEKTRAQCMFLEKSDDIFEVKYTTLAWIGENGIGKTKEGDCKTPEGIYTLSHPFGRKENPGCQIPYIKLDDSWYWVEDGTSKYYNQMVSTDEVEKDWIEAEQLNTFGYSYNYSLAIDFNKEKTPGVGSAIFLHCTHNSPTRGCIAIEEEYMIEILKMLKEDTVIAIYLDENSIF